MFPCLCSHAHVALHYKNSALAEWAQKQREDWAARNEGKVTDLTNERMEKLNDISFDWVGKREQDSDSV